MNRFGFTFGGSVRGNLEPMSADQIRRVAPSVFAESPHESRSSRYTYIPTARVLEGLEREGFRVYSAVQGKTRVPGKADYTKHMLRLRHESQAGLLSHAYGATREGVHEIVLINSHDGTSSYNLMSGYYRLICANGLTSWGITEDQRIPHKGDVTGDVIEGCYRVLDEGKNVLEHVDNMRSIRVSDEEALVFARAALEYRYGVDEETGNSLSPVSEGQVLQARRYADTDNTVWHVFNRVQENMIRGGLRGRKADGRRSSTREVRGIDQDTGINRALWRLAEGLAELKSAA